MAGDNVTSIILLGFPSPGKVRVTLFCLFLTIYCLSIAGNILIIILVLKSKSLYGPMYFLLTQLSLSDILLTTNIVPNLLCALCIEMSMSSCLTQFYFFGASESSECLLLMVMSYDRYLAICHPLRYNSIMTGNLCIKLVTISWVLSFFILFCETLNVKQLHFCGSNVIDHFFCDYVPLLKLSCSDISMVHIRTSVLCFPVIICPFILIVTSYIYIAFVILRIPTSLGRQKAFSTCSSHLAVVCTYYGTLIAVYVVPMQGRSMIINKLLSISYTVLTPLLNPIIYSLRNNEIKTAFWKLIK